MAGKDCIWPFISAKKTSTNHTNAPSSICPPQAKFCNSMFELLKLPQISHHGKALQQCEEARRRRSNMETDTYVLMEPGKAEEFVTEEELRVRLKDWPATSPPPDLAIFKSIADAVSHLVNEHEIHGNVGSIQWYEVRLE